jgi:hypothetical protein
MVIVTIEEFGKIINNDNTIREEYLYAEKKALSMNFSGNTA